MNDFLNTRSADIAAAQEYLLQAQQRQAHHADKKRRDIEFKEGDRVKLSTENTPVNVGPAYKLKARFAGPFTITQKISRTAYKLKLPNDWAIHPVFHISRLYPFHTTDQFPGRPKPRPLPTMQQTADAKGYYEYDNISDRRQKRNADGTTSWRYKVRWKDYAPEDDTWESYNALNIHGKRDVWKLGWQPPNAKPIKSAPTTRTTRV